MKIWIIGYGKMGKAIRKLAVNNGHEVIAIARDANELNELLRSDAKPDVALEFSSPDSGYENISSCIKAGIPIVSGTTGWLERYDELKQLVQKENGSFFYAPNFSIGMNIVFRLAQNLGEQYHNFGDLKASITESHHTEKKDKPSGTAVKLAEDFLSKNRILKNWALDEEAERDLPVHSTREEEVVGIHRLSFENDLESFFLEHKAKDRNVFAFGALKAAEFLKGKKGCFSMDDLLGF